MDMKMAPLWSHFGSTFVFQCKDIMNLFMISFHVMRRFFYDYVFVSGEWTEFIEMSNGPVLRQYSQFSYVIG